MAETKASLFEYLSPGLRETLAAIAVLKAVSSITSLKYIIKDLKVSLHVKRVLIAEAVFLMIDVVLTSIGYVQAFWLDIKTSMSCGFVVDLIPLTLMFHIVLTMMLAIMRSYKTSKVIKNKVADDVLIKDRFYQGLALISVIILALIILGAAFGIHSSFLAPKCHHGEYEGVNFVFAFAAISLVSSAVTFYYDLNLVFLIRDYNRSNADFMVSWSNKPSGIQTQKVNQKEKLANELKNSGPIMSSIFTCGTFLLVAICLGMAGAASEENFGFTQWVLVLGNITVLAHLPMILIFTVRSQDKEKTTSVLVPSGLQFHDDGNDYESAGDLEEDEGVMRTLSPLELLKMFNKRLSVLSTTTDESTRPQTETGAAPTWVQMRKYDVSAMEETVVNVALPRSDQMSSASALENVEEQQEVSSSSIDVTRVVANDVSMMVENIIANAPNQPDPTGSRLEAPENPEMESGISSINSSLMTRVNMTEITCECEKCT